MKKTIILQDPLSFSVYDLKIKNTLKRVVIIGEVHDDIVDCKSKHDNSTQYISVSDFINRYHQSIGNDKMLDIFSESFYIGGKKLGWLPTLRYYLYMTSNLDDTRALSYIRKRLDSCSSPKDDSSFYKCPENLRVHLCDVRFVKQTDSSIKRSNPQECMVDKLFKIGLSYINQDKIPKVSYAICNLISFTRNFLFNKESAEYHINLSEYIIKETKIHKQMENIPTQAVRRKLKRWSHSNYDKAITNARKKFILFEKTHMDDIRQYNNGTEYVHEEFIKAFVKNISLQILNVISVFMDMYLSARLLRKFDDDSYAENSIIYVGEFHAKKYRDLMKILGAKEVFSKTSPHKTSCVDISKFYDSLISPSTP